MTPSPVRIVHTIVASRPGWPSKQVTKVYVGDTFIASLFDRDLAYKVADILAEAREDITHGQAWRMIGEGMTAPGLRTGSG